MSIGWLTNRFENKDRLVSLVTMMVGERWLQWITGRVDDLSTLALLPDSPDEIPALDVWLTLQELGQHHEGVGSHIASVRAHERLWVATLLRNGPTHHPSPDEINGLVALIDGLRVALCSPRDPLDAEDLVSVADAKRLLLAQQQASAQQLGVGRGTGVA